MCTKSDVKKIVDKGLNDFEKRFSEKFSKKFIDKIYPLIVESVKANSERNGMSEQTKDAITNFKFDCQLKQKSNAVAFSEIASGIKAINTANIAIAKTQASILEKLELTKKDNELKYSSKWVETTLVWAFRIAGGSVILAIIGFILSGELTNK